MSPALRIIEELALVVTKVRVASIRVMGEDKNNIVVLGASYAGIASAHFLLKHVVPSLPDKGSRYRVVLVNPSAYWFTRIAAPCAIVSDTLMPDEKTFHDISSAFTSRYPEDTFEFVLGKAVAVETSSQVVTVATLPSGDSKPETRRFQYHALIIATGTRAFSPVFGLTSDEATLRTALDAFRKKLLSAKHVVVAGGGPAGVESAGQIGQFFNGSPPGWFASRHDAPSVKITVITSDSKLLPILRPSMAREAERLLARVGVEVMYNTKVERTTPEDAGLTAQSFSQPGSVKVSLSNGQSLDADVYLPAYGVTPNTEFLPRSLLDERGFVVANGATLRVDGAGPRVYVVGDAGNYSRGGVFDILTNAVPVLMANVKRDLLAASGGEGPPLGKDKLYKRDDRETHLVPIGKGRGVGAVFGWRMPGLAVWAIKGRDYFAGSVPAQLDGSMWDGKGG